MEPKLNVFPLEKVPWILKFDGSSMEEAVGDGVVIISSSSIKTSLAFNQCFLCINNQVRYKVIIIGLEILKDLDARDLNIIEDSQLVIHQPN